MIERKIRNNIVYINEKEIEKQELSEAITPKIGFFLYYLNMDRTIVGDTGLVEYYKDLMSSCPALEL